MKYACKYEKSKIGPYFLNIVQIIISIVAMCYLSGLQTKQKELTSYQIADYQERCSVSLSQKRDDVFKNILNFTSLNYLCFNNWPNHISCANQTVGASEVSNLNQQFRESAFRNKCNKEITDVTLRLQNKIDILMQKKSSSQDDFFSNINELEKEANYFKSLRLDQFNCCIVQ